MKLVAFLAGMAAAFALYALGAWWAFRAQADVLTPEHRRLLDAETW